ncbi:Uncharacterised protein [Vibrio cholerae]|nr:Uncharacterised protein [Vibrio cholerae]CSC09903.1 Uncharacterised protein [Vibrio cholerae]CSH97405.1 Uncharacterised protein [Vibrio cholerae]
MLNPITESGRSLHLIEQRFDTQVDARFFIERVFKLVRSHWASLGFFALILTNFACSWLDTFGAIV